ncbi:MAG: LysM peptidoglycan-binding domain-containing protein [Pseudonocardiales bacterium]
MLPVAATVLGVILFAAFLSPDEPAPRLPVRASDYGSGDPFGVNRTRELPSSLELPLRNLQPLPTYPSLGCRQPTAYLCSQPFLAPDYLVHFRHFVVVKRGDNLSSIACRHQTTVAELVKLNDLSSTDLAVGQRLFVPGPAVPAIADQCRSNS